MSFDSLMIHPLVLVSQPQSDEEADLDEYGHPTADGDPVVTPFLGRVYSRSAREVAETAQGGAGLSDHTIRTRATISPLGVDYIAHADPSDHTRADPDDGRRYELVGVHQRNARAGLHHLELDVRLVTATPGQTVAAEPVGS